MPRTEPSKEKVAEKPIASASAAQSVPASAVTSASASPPPLPFREVDTGYAVDPLDAAPPRPDMQGTAALVWQTIAAPANPSGPRERDTTRTLFVVVKDGRAEIVAERDEAVMFGGNVLWHLASRDVKTTVEDCTVEPPKKKRVVHKQLVFESIEKKRRTLALMGAHVESGEWTRLDLVSMVGPWVVSSVDHYSSECSGRPIGSAYRALVDLDKDSRRTVPIPDGALGRHKALVKRVMSETCGGDDDEIQSNQMLFHYDRKGDLVVDYDFSQYTSSACFHGIAHVFVGTYDLPAELSAYGKLPGWLRAFITQHPTNGVSVLPLGREDAIRAEFDRLPKTAPKLPRDSNPDEE